MAAAIPLMTGKPRPASRDKRRPAVHSWNNSAKRREQLEEESAMLARLKSEHKVTQPSSRNSKATMPAAAKTVQKARDRAPRSADQQEF
jgi:hypothetical protein